MKQRLVATTFFVLMVMGLVASAQAQDAPYRYGKALYVDLHAPTHIYIGDLDENPDNSLSTMIEDAGLGVGLEIGHMFNEAFSLGLRYTFADHTKLRPNSGDRVADANGDGDLNDPEDLVVDISETDDPRHHIMLMGRYRFWASNRLSPYLMAGLGTAFGNINGETSFGFGIAGGVGLEYALNPRWGLSLEIYDTFILPDDAYDGINEIRVVNGVPTEVGGGGADVAGFISLGIRYHLTPPPVAPSGVVCSGPSGTIDIGEEATFSATYNMDSATKPVMTTWDFGSGTPVTGTTTVTRSWDTPGTYTVTFRAENRVGAASCSTSITVVDPIIPPEIVTMRANPNSPMAVTDRVTFSANVRGTAPLTYQWNFGDGNTSTAPSPTHTYQNRAGDTYTVTLTVSNEAGSDTETMRITVRPYENPICATAQMGSVFFDRNSSTLTAQARATLQENARILTECPNINVRIEGYAAPGERNAQRLSEDRARAVEQFYRDAGVAASRMVVEGKGRVAGVSRKEDGSRYRRVDTIIIGR